MQAHRAIFIMEMMVWLSYSGRSARRANPAGMRVLDSKWWCSGIESDVVRAAGTYR
jgi:hypothetical protein